MDTYRLFHVKRGMNMQNWNWHLWIQDFQTVLQQGNPPLYVQLAAATAIFVALRIYFLWKRKYRKGLTPPAHWLTTAWIGVLIILSLGVVEYAQFIYREYLRTIYFNMVT